MKKKGYDFKRFWFYDFIKILGLWCWLIWFRPKKYYIDDEAKKELKKFTFKGGCLVASNHRSHFDVVHLQNTFIFRHHLMISAKDVVSNSSALGFFKLVGTVMVDRNHFSVAEFKEVIGLLKAGHFVHIFPEGKLNPEKELLPFKEGTVIFASTAHVPIIPCYYKTRKNFLGRVKYYYGKPIYLDELGLDTKDKREEATKYLYEKVNELKVLMESK